MTFRFLRVLIPAVLVAGVAVVVFLLVGGTTVAVPWQVASVGADGRSLLVQVDVRSPLCEREPKVEVVKADSEMIELSARVSDHKCTDQAQTARAQVRVLLNVQVSGQRIGGPSKTLQRLRLAPEARGRMPRVIGLRFDDARAALRTAGFTRVSAPRSGVVVGQVPPAGTTVPGNPDVGLAQRVALTVD